MRTLASIPAIFCRVNALRSKECAQAGSSRFCSCCRRAASSPPSSSPSGSRSPSGRFSATRRRWRSWVFPSCRSAARRVGTVSHAGTGRTSRGSTPPRQRRSSSARRLSSGSAASSVPRASSSSRRCLRSCRSEPDGRRSSSTSIRAGGFARRTASRTCPSSPGLSGADDDSTCGTAKALASSHAASTRSAWSSRPVSGICLRGVAAKSASTVCRGSSRRRSAPSRAPALPTSTSPPPGRAAPPSSSEVVDGST